MTEPTPNDQDIHLEFLDVMEALLDTFDKASPIRQQQMVARLYEVLNDSI